MDATERSDYIKELMEELTDIIHEMNRLGIRFFDLHSKVSGIQARVSYFQNTGERLKLNEQHQETTGNNGEIQHEGVQDTTNGIKPINQE